MYEWKTKSANFVKRIQMHFEYHSICMNITLIHIILLIVSNTYMSQTAFVSARLSTWHICMNWKPSQQILWREFKCILSIIQFAWILRLSISFYWLLAIHICLRQLLSVQDCLPGTYVWTENQFSKFCEKNSNAFWV